MEIKVYGTSVTLHGIESTKDVEPYWPGFAALWKQIQAVCETKQRRPRSITFSEEAEPVYANDYDSCERIVVDLATNRVIDSRFVSTGENAINAGVAALPVEGVPQNVALLTCTYSNYYRTFSIRAQFPKGSLVKLLPQTK